MRMRPHSANKGVLPRLLATHVLTAVMGKQRSLKAELARVLPELRDPRDRALLEAMCFTALRQRARYERALQKWLQKPFKRTEHSLHTLLLVGLAQLDGLQLPPHAALSATVDTARALGFTRQSGLVNALLRRAQREGLPDAQATDGWPSWLLAQLQQDWPEQMAAILQASNQPAPLWLRVNRQRYTRSAYLALLHEVDIQAHISPVAADALCLPVAVSVTHLPGFAEGGVSIQDISAQQAADALAPTPNARVLDACAAPGGKAAHLLERDPRLKLTALEMEAQRLPQIGHTFARLGVGADAPIIHADASAAPIWWDGQFFDAMVLDVPCSATGIIRRQPDILLHRRRDDVAALTVIQARLLDRLWPLLRPGGVLLYTTCSILRCENHQQIHAFMRRTKDACIDTLPQHLGHLESGMAQRLPGEDDGDGFFYARLLKK